VLGIQLKILGGKIIAENWRKEINISLMLHVECILQKVTEFKSVLHKILMQRTSYSLSFQIPSSDIVPSKLACAKQAPAIITQLIHSKGQKK
jgi:hypothetical protein